MTGTFIKIGDTITFQLAPYIEDGWFIVMRDKSNYIELWEIPQFGGDPYKVDVFYDLFSTLQAAQNLT